jgi:hypothetical protein
VFFKTFMYSGVSKHSMHVNNLRHARLRNTNCFLLTFFIIYFFHI